MADQQIWFRGQHDAENIGVSLASDTEAYTGHLDKAQELTKQSVDSAIRADSKETGAIWQENAALREAAFGNTAKAKQAAAEGLRLAPASQAVGVEAALAYAMAGDTERAESLVQDLNKRLPLDTQVQSLWLTAIRAQLALDRKDARAAIASLQAASSIELGQIAFVTNISGLYPTYIRGEAYLAVGEGKFAATEFQKIVDHRGIVWNCWTGSLAHLGLARANAMQSKSSQGADADAARTRALAAYRDFLALWKDADPDIPILKQAKTEYARLQLFAANDVASLSLEIVHPFFRFNHPTHELIGGRPMVPLAQSRPRHSRREILKSSVLTLLPLAIAHESYALPDQPPIPANGSTDPYPIPWLDKNGSHNQPAGANLEPSHIYHFKGRVARCSTFTGMGTDNQGNRIAFGSRTTDYGVMRGEYWAARAAQQGTFTHI